VTQPNPEENNPPKPPTSSPKAAPTKGQDGVAMLDVVDYVHHDPILGGQTQQIGVVVGVDDQTVHIAPLAGYRVQVSVGDVIRLSADDLSAVED
jgi:hypothetical protein